LELVDTIILSGLSPLRIPIEALEIVLGQREVAMASTVPGDDKTWSHYVRHGFVLNNLTDDEYKGLVSNNYKFRPEISLLHLRKTLEDDKKEKR
jgi:hypothetical protein